MLPKTVSRPRLILFDFDGTLADTRAHALAILNKLAPRYRYRSLSEAEAESLRDLNHLQFIRHLGIRRLLLPVVLFHGRRELRKSLHTVLPFSGMVELIDELRATGAVIGIVTSNSKHNVERFLRYHKISGVDLIVSCRRLGSKSRKLARLVRKHAVAPHEAILVGDEVRDIQAAQQAGIRSAAVGWGFNSAKALQAQAPDHFVEHPSDLGHAVLHGWKGRAASPTPPSPAKP